MYCSISGYFVLCSSSNAGFGPQPIIEELPGQLETSLLTPLARDLRVTEGMAGQTISNSGLFAVVGNLVSAHRYWGRRRHSGRASAGR